MGRVKMEKEKLFCGFHAARNALRSCPSNGELLHDGRRDDARLGALLDLAARAGVPVRLVSREELNRVAVGVRHQGVIVRLIRVDSERPAGLPEYIDGLAETPLILVLDAIQDPHNLGACLRSAAAAGVHGVVLSQNKGCSLTPSAIRVAAGAVSHLRIFEESNWTRLLKTLKQKGLWLIGADAFGDQSVFDVDLTEPTAIIVGSEDSGLRQVTRGQCDRIARIPLPGRIDSLNVSVAAGVMLFEAVRQRTVSQSLQAGS